MLAADAMTDDGENVLATEVLWTPQVCVYMYVCVCVCLIYICMYMCV